MRALFLSLIPLVVAAQPASDWREAARERIEKTRKGDLTVRVVDTRGRVVPGAEIHARMTRHAFGWGSAVAAQMLLGTSDDSERYRKFILDNFNTVVFENDLKWPQWEQNRQRALDGIAWMREHGITHIRGHNLVWPSWRWLPRDLKDLAGDPAALRKRVDGHIADEIAATRGLIPEWDVMNEPYSNHDLMDILSKEEPIRWFKAARAGDPKAKLYINDFDIIANGAENVEHRNHYRDTIRFLLDQGAPIDGIGIQGHFTRPTAPETMLKILDEFAAFGKPIAITEYDFNIKDEQLQAQFTRDLLLVCFSHPAVDEFLMWGFWEGRHWRPNGAMVRRDWTTKPNYDVWRDLVYKEWWTDSTGRTGRQGAWRVRGFLGDYAVEAAAGARKGTATAALSKGGIQVTVVVK
jgi:endo-1,4-beta-xylanase